MNFNKIPPLLNKLAAITTALIALLVAGQVGAQTIPAPGLKGPQACVGTAEINRFDLAEVTGITASSARFTPKSFNNLYT